MSHPNRTPSPNDQEGDASKREPEPIFVGNLPNRSARFLDLPVFDTTPKGDASRARAWAKMQARADRRALRIFGIRVR